MPIKRFNANSTGEVNYSYNVIKSIILLATQEISGISGIKGKGVKMDINGNTVNVDIFVDVLNDVSCSDVAFRVQENIKRSVESMTDFLVGVVNVNILGVNFTQIQ